MKETDVIVELAEDHTITCPYCQKDKLLLDDFIDHVVVNHSEEKRNTGITFKFGEKA